MDSVDDRDEVVRLQTPRPCPGVPLPQLVADEREAWLAYHVHEPDPDWDGSNARIITRDSPDLLIAEVVIHKPLAIMFGPPNDEAFEGHPLAERGLEPCGVFEIVHSSWLRGLEQRNSVHPLHDRRRFLADRRHFVFAFHDSTLECIASGFVVRTMRGSIRGVMASMAEALDAGRR